MFQNNYIIIIIIMSMVLFAGCSGTIFGEETPPPPNPTSTPKQTVKPTLTATPESTQIVTPSPTVTPSEGENPQLFAQQIGNELERFRSDETWVQETKAHANDTVSIYVRKPADWTVKQTEMESTREAVRGTVIGTTINSTEAKSTERFLRPEAIHIHVRTEEKKPLTTITIDTALAVRYADGDTRIEEFAELLGDTRQIHTKDMNLGENSTVYYLKKAEWRLLQQEQAHLIRQADQQGEKVGVLTKIEVLPENNEIYYEYSPPGVSNATVREGTFMRTYWEAIRNVSHDRLIHRYPERMRVYANVPGEADMESSIRTEYAFDFLEITDGDISDENILTSGAWDAYYNKINRTYHEDR